MDDETAARLSAAIEAGEYRVGPGEPGPGLSEELRRRLEEQRIAIASAAESDAEADDDGRRPDPTTMSSPNFRKSTGGAQ